MEGHGGGEAEGVADLPPPQKHFVRSNLTSCGNEAARIQVVNINVNRVLRAPASVLNYYFNSRAIYYVKMGSLCGSAV
jgi:hypothetical protein